MRPTPPLKESHICFLPCAGALDGCRKDEVSVLLPPPSCCAAPPWVLLPHLVVVPPARRSWLPLRAPLTSPALLGPCGQSFGLCLAHLRRRGAADLQCRCRQGSRWVWWKAGDKAFNTGGGKNASSKPSSRCHRRSVSHQNQHARACCWVRVRCGAQTAASTALRPLLTCLGINY